MAIDDDNGAGTQAGPADRPKSRNATLIELASVWQWDGDWMRCRGCKAVLIASRDGEPLRHKSDDCKHVAHVHPWADLRNALST